MADETETTPPYPVGEGLLPFVVVETEAGAEIRERSSGEIVATHETTVAALDDLLTDPHYAAKTPMLRDPETKELVGAWRWHDMSAVEAAPAADGSQITAMGIARMAARLNASPDPLMIDGGSADSDAHESTKRSDTRSNGYTHVCAEVVYPDGRLHLWGWSEVFPEIAREMDANRLAWGSIAFLTGEDNDDAELYSHALTNKPAVPGLHPAGTPRSQRPDARALHVRAYRLEGITMAKITIRAKLRALAEKRALAQRGPALDAFLKLATMLGVSVDEEMEAECWESPTVDKVRALKQLALDEKLYESVLALAATAMAPATTTAAASASTTTPAPAASAADKLSRRQLEMFDSPEAQDAWTQQMLDVARAIAGTPDGAPADVLDVMKAGQDAMAAALAVTEPPGETPTNDDPAAMADTPPTEGEPDEDDEETNMADKTQDAGARAKLVGLEAKNKTLEARVRELEGEAKKRSARDFVLGEIAKRQMTFADDKSREEFVAETAEIHEQHGEKMALVAIRAAHVPPSGAVFSRGGSVSSPLSTMERGSQRNDAEIEKRARQREAEIRRAEPKLPRHKAWARALREVRSENPELFGQKPAA